MNLSPSIKKSLSPERKKCNVSPNKMVKFDTEDLKLKEQKPAEKQNKDVIE